MIAKVDGVVFISWHKSFKTYKLWGHFLVLNNLCVLVLNARVIQLLNNIIKVDTISINDLVELCGCASWKVVEILLQFLVLVIVLEVRKKLFFLLVIINCNLNYVN